MNFNFFKMKSCRFYFQFFGVTFWLLLALLSRLPMSPLQIELDMWAIFAIFFWIPLCIYLGFYGVPKTFEQRITKFQVGPTGLILFLSTIVFFIFFIICFINVPPIFSESPNNSRLNWGIKFLHVVTEIVIRTSVLTIIATSIVKKKIPVLYLTFLGLAVLYSILVVSRSLMMEFVFYFYIYYLFVVMKKKSFVKFIVKQFVFVGILLSLFYVFGELRQGSNFNIVTYGSMYWDFKVVAWLFGYLLVNFDNLALVISAPSNGSLTNIFGPVLQSLQISRYTEVDSYPYVGRFNLGTALRPYIQDFNIFFGPLVFAACLFFFSSFIRLARYQSSRISLILLLLFSTFCFPITSRIESPPYLFSALAILFSDQIFCIFKFQGTMASIKFAFLGEKKI